MNRVNIQSSGWTESLVKGLLKNSKISCEDVSKSFSDDIRKKALTQGSSSRNSRFNKIIQLAKKYNSNLEVASLIQGEGKKRLFKQIVIHPCKGGYYFLVLVVPFKDPLDNKYYKLPCFISNHCVIRVCQAYHTNNFNAIGKKLLNHVIHRSYWDTEYTADEHGLVIWSSYDNDNLDIATAKTYMSSDRISGDYLEIYKQVLKLYPAKFEEAFKEDHVLYYSGLNPNQDTIVKLKFK